MRITRVVMGMPAAVEIPSTESEILSADVFRLWDEIDARFSTYKPESEVMRANRGEVAPVQYSAELKEVLALAEKTKRESGGFFDIARPDGTFDPSGIVKGWAIQKAADMLTERGVSSYFLDIGGDIQSAGNDADGREWTVGVRNPFKHEEIVKILAPRGRGVATSGTAARGAHIYNPHTNAPVETDVMSITVLGPDILEADRFATAAFAMGRQGISFIAHLPDFEGYLIDREGIATMTPGLEAYVI